MITPKGLAKNTAKNTGIALVQGYKNGSESNENIYHAMIAPVPRSSSKNSINGSVNDLSQPSTSKII